MPYFDTGYNTTAGMCIETRTAEKAIKEAAITGGLLSVTLGVDQEGPVRPCFLLGNTEEAHIPPMIHPFLLKGYKGCDYLVTDVRAFRGAVANYYTSPKDFETHVRNKPEYLFTKHRTILSLLWLNGQATKLRASLLFAGTVYASWISGAIAKAYALDLNDQARITALAIYFYHSLFTEETKLEGERLETAVIHSIRVTKLPAKEIYALYESLPAMANCADFCKVLSTSGENVRLRDFNLPMFLTLVRNTWYGTHSDKLLPVAVEHPPTWLAIVYTTMTERSYRNSPLNRTIENLGKRGASEEFIQNFLTLVGSRVLVTEAIDNAPLVFPDFKD